MRLVSYLLVLMLLLTVNLLNSQEAKTVLIEGMSTSYESAKTMRIEIDFSESSGVCGPGMEFNTVYDQFYSFVDKLKELEIKDLKFEETNRIANFANESNKITFATIVNDSINLGSKLSYAGKYAFSDEIRYIDVFEDQDFEDEDKYAIDALDDAKEKAELLMSTFGYSQYEIIYIDDNTSPSRENGAKPTTKKREFRVHRDFFEEKELSRYKLFVGFRFFN